jgi:hypothetical protein
VRAALEGVPDIVGIRRVRGVYYIAIATHDIARDCLIAERLFTQALHPDYRLVPQRSMAAVPPGVEI